MVIVSETSKKFPYGPYMIQLRLNLRRNDSIFTLTQVKIGIYHCQNLYNIFSMVQNIYHLESKRVENLVFSSKMGGENGIFSQKCRSGDFGIFQKSPI